MSQVLNGQSLITAIGILQPVRAVEVVGFLQTVLPDGGKMPTPAEVLAFLKEREGMGHVIRVSRSSETGDMYSLTLAGHRYLTPRQRRVRDKFRFYLLRDARRRKYNGSVGEAQGLVGDAPTVDNRPLAKGSVANKIGQRVPSGRSYWPRVQKQFDFTGLTASPADTFPEWLSFATERQGDVAIGCREGAFEFRFEGLAAALGVSPRIISQIVSKPHRHYRSFTIKKRSGGDRVIESPRVFLKVIQWYLADFVLSNIPIHHCCHAFLIGRSIVTNAQPHIGKSYVASIDIENFFGSITQDGVFRLLKARGFKQAESWLLARLCCKDGVLPQGAPTSPVLSNAFLFGFDDQMAVFCGQNGLDYSRYADDVTFSGSSREAVLSAVEVARDILQRQYGLSLNADKTRISTRYSQQRIAGVVVNSKALPPRIERRKVRAMIHNALSAEGTSKEKLAEIRGRVAYLGMFPELRGSHELNGYIQGITLLGSRQPDQVTG